jgi:hypothetical protein
MAGGRYRWLQPFDASRRVDGGHGWMIIGVPSTRHRLSPAMEANAQHYPLNKLRSIFTMMGCLTMAVKALMAIMAHATNRIGVARRKFLVMTFAFPIFDRVEWLTRCDWHRRHARVRTPRHDPSRMSVRMTAETGGAAQIIALHEPAVAHHVIDVAQVAQARARIAIDQDQVGQLALRDRTALTVEARQARGDNRRRRNRFGGREAGLMEKLDIPNKIDQAM